MDFLGVYPTGSMDLFQVASKLILSPFILFLRSRSSRVSLDDTCGATQDDIRRVAAELKDFKHMDEQFQKLSNCIKAIRITAEQRLKAARLRIGIASLPDELLANIFHFVTQEEDHKDVLSVVFRGFESFKSMFLSAVKLSHVCDRFRRVALLTPSLWNGISDDMTPHMVKLSLIRSGRMPLDITFLSFQSTMDRFCFYNPKHFTRLVSKTSDRWRSLKIYSSVGIGIRDKEFSLKSLNLPLLTNLKIDSPSDRRRSEQHILRDWNTPRLQSMTICQFIPPPFQQSSSLRCLRVDLRGSGRLTMDIQALRKFLLSCKLLTELKIRVTDTRIVNTARQPSNFRLPCVEAVTFEIPSCRPELVKSLLEEIRFPVTSKLELVLGLDPSRNRGSLLFDNISPFFLDESIFPAVTTLNLTVNCDPSMVYGFGPVTPFSIPFILLGNIQHLTLSISGFDQLIPSEDDLPALRSLRLENCDCIDSSWIFDAVENLNQRGNLGELDLLSISDCDKHLCDIEVKCRSFPQGALLAHLQTKLPAPCLIKKERPSFTSARESNHFFGGNRDISDWLNEIDLREDLEQEAVYH